jgi:ribosomal protein L36
MKITITQKQICAECKIIKKESIINVIDYSFGGYSYIIIAYFGVFGIVKAKKIQYNYQVEMKKDLELLCTVFSNNGGVY